MCVCVRESSCVCVCKREMREREREREMREREEVCECCVCEREGVCVCPLFASIHWPGQAGLTSAGSSGCGIRWLLAGPDSLPVALSCMCFCVAEVFFLFSHCTPQGA